MPENTEVNNQEEVISKIPQEETIEPKEPQKVSKLPLLADTKKLTILAVKIFAGLLGIVFLIVIGTYVAALFKKPIVEEEKPIVIVPPTQVVQTFYTWYMDYKGNPIETGAYKFNKNLSTLFINDIDNRVYKEQLNYDPFICSVDKPLGIAVVKEDTQETTSTVTINEDFGIDTQINVRLSLEGTTWMITGIECPQIEEQKQQEEQKTKTKVTLYFNNTTKEPEGNTECGLVYEAERTIDKSLDPLTTAIKELFKGPTKAEGILGYTSVFSSQTEGMLKELRITDDIAYINLKDYKEVLTNVTTSCNSVNFINQIEKTIKHYRDVDKVIIAIEGKTEDFYNWVQIGCNEDNNNCDNKGFE